MSNDSVITLREPSLWTLLFWPRYGRKYQSFAVMFVLIALAFASGIYLASTYVWQGALLSTSAVLVHLVIGVLVLTLELLGNNKDDELEDV